MTEEPTIITITEDSTEGVPPELHPVIKEYGRSMFATLMNAGQANSAAEALNAIVSKLPILETNHGKAALSGLVQAFNQLNVAYLAEMNWPEERMVACQAEITAAMQTAIIKAVPPIMGTDGQPLMH